MFSNARVDGDVEARSIYSLVFRGRIDDLGRLMAWQRAGMREMLNQIQQAGRTGFM
jgi:hypothetical protein